MTSKFSRRRFIVSIGLAILPCAACHLEPATPSERVTRPNFILFFVDDMGYGDLSCYGHPTIRTPRLDHMAEEGIRLTSFYAAASFCTPSRVALMTGRYAERTGLHGNLGPGSKGGLPLSEVTLAEVLKKRGYRTMAIGKWHLGHDPVEYLPTSRGFDAYYGLLYSNDMIPPWVNTDRPLELYRDTEPIEHPVEQSTLTERYTKEAVAFIREAKNDPFFLYIPHSMPHLPVSASDRFRGESRSGLYGDVIETLDWSVGRVLDVLEEEGIDRRTMVIFTSDNGPWLNLPPRMLQKGVEPWHAGSPGPLRGQKNTTYEGGMRVPCIVRWPGCIPAGQVSEDMATTMDLYTTLIEAAGGRVPSDRVVDGNDILPMLEGRSASTTTELFYLRSNHLEAVREGRWKYRLSRSGRTDLIAGEPLTPELFDLEVDPSERYNVADRHPDIVGKLGMKLEAFAGELGAKHAGALRKAAASRR
jgi:arylsulfatase A-like enzyme